MRLGCCWSRSCCSTLSELDQEPRTQSTLTALSTVLSYHSNSSPPGAGIENSQSTHANTHSLCPIHKSQVSYTSASLVRQWCEWEDPDACLCVCWGNQLLDFQGWVVFSSYELLDREFLVVSQMFWVVAYWPSQKSSSSSLYDIPAPRYDQRRYIYTKLIHSYFSESEHVHHTLWHKKSHLLHKRANQQLVKSLHHFSCR